MNDVKQLRCKVVFDTNIEKTNPLFSKVKIKIAYTGANRNGSYISKDAFEKALPTIYNCPIIGEFIETIEDFGSHGGKIEISDKGIKYIQTTKPYGVINESSEITWEDIVEEDGTINTYLCATGYLWTGRYDELFSVIENSKSQSMEIDVNKGAFKTIDNKDVYDIEDFIFSAFCILGDAVEPCFESSEVTTYNFNKDSFKTEFNQMLSELKEFSTPKIDFYFIEKEKAIELVNKANEIFTKLGFNCSDWIVDGKECDLTGIINKTLNKEATENWGFEIYDRDTITIKTNDIDKMDTATISVSSVELLLSNKDETQKFSLIPKKLGKSNFNINTGEGGNKLVDEKLELLAKYSLTVEQLDFSIDDFSLEDLEVKLQEFVAQNQNCEDASKTVVSFSATYKQKLDALENALDPKIERDADGNITYEEYIYPVDFDDTYVFVRKSIWTPEYERMCGRFTYTFDESTITATLTSEFEKMIDDVWLTQAEYDALMAERNTTTTEFEALKAEIETLRQFKTEILETERKDAEDALFEQFTELAGIEEFETLKTKASDYELDDIEKECFAILGRKNAKFSVAKTTKKEKVKVEFTKKNDESTDEVEELFTKYLNK